MRNAILALVALMLSTAAVAGESDRYHGSCRPVGTWFVNVLFPGQTTPAGDPLGFQQLISLNADRTLTETNTTLHPNSNPIATPVGEPPYTGSDGFGSWKRLRGCRVKFSFLKFIFAPTPLPNGDAMQMGPPPGFLIGYFKVSGIATVRGNTFSSKAGDIEAKRIFGFNPLDPDADTMTFGDSVSMGFKILPTD